ncbi:MAG: hypothetical protein ACLSHW_07830 [Lachnospiraceae bacterium]
MNGDVYLWPSAAEKKLRTAYQTELPAYLYGVTGVGKTSLIEHFLEKKPYSVCFGAEHDTGRSG